MPTPTTDPRRATMITVLVPLLRASCPPDAGGYGGGLELRMPDAEADELGGAELLRSAARAAARRLGWKTETYGLVGTRHGTMVGVVDRREAPAPFAEAVQRDKSRRMRAAVDRVGRPGATPPAPAPVPGNDPRMPTVAFRAAYAEARPAESASDGDA
ncbi:hypothetical protein [Streptomyces mobaraensis]|uniref:Uncharacterized protein n=1 Tax=Streptomyces mobaraensis TaxID=35621 RepID=A0A5N5W1J8_STRMB|nr:hypothetical protein [Streptomyces mobaraensis]KAB7835563.1 hypothetical protein FRZ00_27145 [Streptomyces mobaraensis]